LEDRREEDQSPGVRDVREKEGYAKVKDKAGGKITGNTCVFPDGRSNRVTVIKGRYPATFGVAKLGGGTSRRSFSVRKKRRGSQMEKGGRKDIRRLTGKREKEAKGWKQKGVFPSTGRPVCKEKT